MRAPRGLALLVALACAACTSVGGDQTRPSAPPQPAPAKSIAPVAKPSPPARAPNEGAKEGAPPAEPAPAKGSQLVAQAVNSYDDGDYRSASVQLQAALRETLTPTERATAHKYLAFIACANNRAAACRDEFRKALVADPSFDLTPAEAGHPIWGPAFRRAKAEFTSAAKRKRAQ